jgi:hypothetical protein
MHLGRAKPFERIFHDVSRSSYNYESKAAAQMASLSVKALLSQQTGRTGNAIRLPGRSLAVADAIWTVPAVFPLYLQRVSPSTTSYRIVRPAA